MLHNQDASRLKSANFVKGWTMVETTCKIPMKKIKNGLIPNFSFAPTLERKFTFYPKIHILKIPIFHKIHLNEISFFTKFTFQKSHFSQNSHFKNLIFHKFTFLKVSKSREFLDKKWVFAPVCRRSIMLIPTIIAAWST